MEINAKGIGFTPASGYQAAAALQNTAAAVQQPAPASPTVIVSLSAAATAEVKPEDIIDNSYAGRRDASDSVVRAAGMTMGAREIISMINDSAARYNTLKLQLADTARMEKHRQMYGDADADMLTEGIKRSMARYLRQIEEVPGRIVASGMQRFQISGPMVSKTEDGFYKPEKFTMTAAVPGGWSVTVKSTFEAQAIADGVDITSRISDRNRDWGYSYSVASKALQAMEAAASTQPAPIFTGSIWAKIIGRG